MPQPIATAAVDDLSLRTPERFARVVPLAFVTYSLAFLDRNNFGYASKRLDATLHLKEFHGAIHLLGATISIDGTTLSTLIPAIFFLGYALFQIPGASYATRRSVRWLVFWALILWGALSSMMGLITSVPWLLADRFALGCVEGIVLPAMLIYLTRWFRKSERSRANSLLMLANPLTMMWASAASGYIIEHFENHRLLGLEGWQMMFIVEGLPSALWAGIWLWLAHDTPADAHWMDAQSAAAVQAVLDSEQAGIASVKNYWVAFADLRVILLAVMFICFSAASYAFMTWMPRIVEANTPGGIGMTGLLMAIPYMVACVSIVGVSWASDKTLERKRFVWGSHAVGALGYFIAASLGPHYFAIAFVALIVVGSCTYTPTSPLWAWIAEMLPRNVAGEAMALVNSAGALGGFLGIFIGGRISERFPSPSPTFVFCGGCLVAAAILGLSVPARKRDSSLDRG